MSDVVAERPVAGASAPVLARLSVLDRFLPVWIVAAMALGLVLGRTVDGLDDALDTVQVGSVSLPIALGLLLMMYPVLAKVRYGELGAVTSDRRLLVASLVLNWLVGPALMFALAWLLLPDLPEYRTGLIIVGLARCIAMVLIWNDLSGGDREAAAVLVAVNSVFQILAFAGLGYFYLELLPGWLGLAQDSLSVSVWEIARSVLIFLGVPLLAGYLTRLFGERAKGREWYESVLLPRIGPFALHGLLFTIVVLFALQGEAIKLPTRRCRPDCAAAAGVLLPHVRRVLPARALTRARLPADGDARLHRRRQQLRARDRGRHRCFRRHLGPGAGRGCRPAHRGARPGRPRLRCPRRPPAAVPLGGPP